jgi:two-component system, OmpR family, sensor histidine kinase BaeS
MFTVPKASVRVNLAIAILLTIVLSWVLSTGIANYFNYLSIRSLHQEMIKHPEIYPRPIPKPRFGMIEFLTGRPPIPRHREPMPPPRPGTQPQRPPLNEPSRRQHVQFEMRWLLLRLAVALGLASLAGALLGRRFTKPLMQLAEGADAFQSGDFAYRIPADGNDEFAAVAAAMNEMATQVSGHIAHLEEDAERRRRFMADIAHELRSPVTTMRTMAGALQDGMAEDPERRERAVAALARTSERLLRLVQDLMELAKLDLNELPLNVRKVDLCEIIGSAIHSHESAAASAGIVLHPLQARPPLWAMIDPDRITQVIDNILNNAISYAGEGSDIKISVEDEDPIKVHICDTGKGIPAEDLPYIFDSFYRADSARTPGEYHSGLGLSIARRLVEAHGGRLIVSSTEGNGTTVTVVIPR